MATPCCGAVFADFDACFSVKCPSCPMYFCVWCFEHVCDSTGESHDHVRTCPLNPHPGAVYGDYVRWRTEHAPRKRLRRVKAEVQDMALHIKGTVDRLTGHRRTVEQDIVSEAGAPPA